MIEISEHNIFGISEMILSRIILNLVLMIPSAKGLQFSRHNLAGICWPISYRARAISRRRAGNGDDSGGGVIAVATVL